jgi:hypothetical protein
MSADRRLLVRLLNGFERWICARIMSVCLIGRGVIVTSFYRGLAAVVVSLVMPFLVWSQSATEKPNVVTIDWNKTIIVSKSTPTLQVVVNPMLCAGSPIHDGSLDTLKKLGADYVRYVPWEPYPRLAVAELEPPTKSSTSWDFKLIDPMTKDFMDATSGHPIIMNFSIFNRDCISKRLDLNESGSPVDDDPA